MDKTINRWTDPDGNGYAFKDAVARAQKRELIDKISAETADRKAEVDTERKRIDNLIEKFPATAGEYQQSRLVLHGYGNTEVVCGEVNGEYTTVPAFVTDAGGPLSLLYTKKSDYQIAVNKNGLYLFTLRIYINSLTADKRIGLNPFVNGVCHAELGSSYNTAGNFGITQIATIPLWLEAGDTVDFRVTAIDAVAVKLRIEDVALYAIDWDGKIQIPDYAGYVAETKDVRVGADGTVYGTAGEAVRGQVNELKSDLGYKRTDVTGEIIEGYYADITDGCFISFTNAKRTDYIEVAEYTEHFYTGATYFNAGVVGYDKNKNYVCRILGGESGSLSYTNEKLSIPSNVKYIVASGYNPRGDTEISVMCKSTNFIKLHEKIGETESELKNELNNSVAELKHNKLDRKLSSNLLNPDKFRYGYFYFNSGKSGYSEDNVYGCTEPILVKGQNIIGNKIGIKTDGLGSFVVFNKQGEQLRVVDGNQYIYQEGDYSVVVSYLVNGNLEFAKKVALVYGEEYVFEEYTDYLPEYENRKKIKEIESRVLILEEKEEPAKEPINIISPAPVYSVRNDMDETRGIVNTLWIDHFIKNNSTLNKQIGFTDFYNNHVCLSTPLKTEMKSSKVEKELSLDIKSDFFDCSPYSNMTIIHRISKLSGSADTFPKVLVIGDSVTDGYLSNIGKINKNYPNKYWAWCDYFFRLDKMLDYGNDDGKCNYLSVGASSSNGNTYGSADVYSIDGQTKKCYAVGKGGWSAEDLFLPTFEAENNVNPFYDPEARDFSLRYFIDNFKTLENDGKTRLVVGSTAGSKVTNAQSWDVCTPTHVVINLNHNSSLEEYKTNIPRVIEKIKREYPDMIIILMSIDETGTYSPLKYPDSFINTLSHLHDKNIQIYEYIRDNLVDEENGIYLCSGNLVQPTVQSYPSLDYMRAEMYGGNEVYNSKSNGGGPEWHPNNHAHSAWGYQLYSLIKWTMTS